MESDIFDSPDFLSEEPEVADFQCVEDDQENENAGPSSVSIDNRNDLSRYSRIGELASNKAGLQGIDKEKVKQVIYEASKSSAFYLNEARKDEALGLRIEQMMKKYESLKKQNLSTLNSKVDSLVQAIERGRDLTHIIVHVDMDAFYASIEERDNPSLRNKPMAVGDNSMLSTSNYEARNIFSRYDPDYTPMSLDEAYLDITKYLETTDKSPDDVVEQIRREINEETKLTASAGIAANKLLSKICSDLNKPNGQYRLQNNVDDIMNFIRPLSVRKIPGIGRVTEKILSEMDIKTCGEIFDNRAQQQKSVKRQHVTPELSEMLSTDLSTNCESTTELTQEHLDVCLKTMEMNENNDQDMDWLNLSVHDALAMNEHNDNESAEDNIDVQSINADWE
ncbi:5656_t:CDS:2, partial [Racocetra fulgida]